MARSDDKVKLPLSARLKNITPKQVLHASRFYLFLAVLAIVRALSAYIFIVPNGFAPSGITGLSSIIYALAYRIETIPISIFSFYLSR